MEEAMMQKTIRGHIVTEKQVLWNHEISVRDGRIESILPAGETRESLGDCYILPGFREQHIHDWTGQSQVASRAEEAIGERIGHTMRLLARHGVTAVYLATFGDALPNLERYCRAARRWMDCPANGREGTRLEGIHIEGTFLNEECRGAQPAEYCLIPTRDDCREALNRINATGAVKIVNIVPDYGEESLDLIRHASNLGMLVGAGHTRTSADLLRRAYEECGLKFMVHFTNGPTGQSFKPFDGGGAFEGALHLPIVKELILDRIHVDDRYLLDILHQTERRWGIEAIVGVTDALFPDPGEVPSGEFCIGSTAARLHPSGYLCATAYIQPDGSQKLAPPNTLCSSIATMDRAFSNLVNLFTQSIEGHWYSHPALPLEKAVIRAARICSAHQAMLDGCICETGSIAVGKRADLTAGVLENSGDEYRFSVRQTWVDGVPAIPVNPPD